MSRIEHLVESREAELRLSDSEAAALMAAGHNLASDRAWFGLQPPQDRTVIRCVRGNRPESWVVRVQDAVGVIGVGQLQLVVEPKIPIDHLLFLFSKPSSWLDSKLNQRGWVRLPPYGNWWRGGLSGQRWPSYVEA